MSNGSRYCRGGSKCLPANDFTGHRCFRTVNQSFTSQRIDLDAKLVRHEFARFPTSEPIARDDGRRMYTHFDELICSAQKLGSNYYD
jgi:hypothetical protein